MAEAAARDIPTSSQESADIAEQMEQLAANGEWDQIVALSSRLRDSVSSIPEVERREILLSLQRSNDIVHSMVSNARKDIQTQLSSLRRGQSAAKAYKQTTRMTDLR